jgi:hypothetical protein
MELVHEHTVGDHRSNDVQLSEQFSDPRTATRGDRVALQNVDPRRDAQGSAMWWLRRWDRLRRRVRTLVRHERPVSCVSSHHWRRPNLKSIATSKAASHSQFSEGAAHSKPVPSPCAVDRRRHERDRNLPGRLVEEPPARDGRAGGSTRALGFGARPARDSGVRAADVAAHSLIGDRVSTRPQSGRELPPTTRSCGWSGQTTDRRRSTS